MKFKCWPKGSQPGICLCKIRLPSSLPFAANTNARVPRMKLLTHLYPPLFIRACWNLQQSSAKPCVCTLVPMRRVPIESTSSNTGIMKIHVFVRPAKVSIAKTCIRQLVRNLKFGRERPEGSGANQERSKTNSPIEPTYAQVWSFAATRSFTEDQFKVSTCLAWQTSEGDRLAQGLRRDQSKIVLLCTAA